MSIHPKASKFAKDSIFMLIANIVGFLGSLSRGFIIPRLLPVASYGQFNFMLSLSPIFLMLSLGVSAAIPILLPKKNSEEASKKLIKSGVSVILISYLFVAAISILVLLICRSSAPKWIFFAFPVFIAVYFFQEISNFIYGIARTYEHFHVLSLGIFIFNISYLVLSVAFTYLYGFNGLAISFLAANLLLTVFYISKGYLERLAVPDWDNVREMISLGFFQNISTVLNGIISQSDRYILMFLAGATAVGFYAIAFQIGQLAYIVLSSLIQVLSTKIYLECAKTREASRLSDIYKIGTLAYSGLASILGFILFFISAPVINIFLPKYIESIEYTRFLVWLPVVQSVTNISAMVILGTEGIKKLNIFLVIIGITAMPVYFIFWQIFGLKGICIAAIFIGIVTCYMHMRIVVENIGNGKGIFFFVYPSLLILFYTVGTTLFVEYFYGNAVTGSIIHTIMITLIKCGSEMLLMFAGLLGFFYFNRELMDSALNLVKRKKTA